MDDLTSWLASLQGAETTKTSLSPDRAPPTEIVPPLSQDGHMASAFPSSSSGGSDELPALEAFLASIERDASFQTSFESPAAASAGSASTPPNTPTYTLANNPDLAARIALVKNWVPSDDDILPKAKQIEKEPKAAQLGKTPKGSTDKSTAHAAATPKSEKSKKKTDGLVDAATLAASTNDATKKVNGKRQNKPNVSSTRTKRGK